jgi:hypothetical protein
MKRHKYFLLFILFWLLLNFFTASSLELYNDEAYYWMYSRFLDWGYFDHPPGVAVMIWLGNYIGKTEIAVRFFNVLFTTVSISMIYLLAKPKNVLVFCTTIFSFFILHLIGFISLPDTPFFLSAILFFICYSLYLKDNSIRNQILMSLAAAAMIYCKYHGFVVIMFTLLSNVSLLKNYKTYLIGLMTVLLISPHIYWQFVNDFPSISYHLADRAAPEYKIDQTLDYLFGNLPFLGGLVSVVLFAASVFYKPFNLWEKALKWNLLGMYLFFFLITFKGQYIEPNWTLFCVFPMLLLGFKYMEQSRFFEAYKYLTFVFAFIMLILRIHMIWPLVEFKKDRVWDFRGGKEFSKNVKTLAIDHKIAANRYQDASILNFYLNEPYFITSLNISSRANQFSIWQLDTTLCDEKVAFINGNSKGTEIPYRIFSKRYLSITDTIAIKGCQ